MKLQSETQVTSGSSAQVPIVEGRVVILLKFGTYQGNERRRAAPEQHPGDMEGLSLQR